MTTHDRKPNTAKSDLMTFADAAFALNVSQRTIRRLVEDGHLAVVHIRSAARVRRESLDHYLRTVDGPLPPTKHR
jgi:excisionase family DNA binding protein